MAATVQPTPSLQRLVLSPVRLGAAFRCREHELLASMEAGTLAVVDSAILGLLRFGATEEESARATLAQFDAPSRGRPR